MFMIKVSPEKMRGLILIVLVLIRPDPTKIKGVIPPLNPIRS